MSRLRSRLDARLATHAAAKSLNRFANAALFQAMKIDPNTGLSDRITELLRAEVHRFPEVRAERDGQGFLNA